MEFQQQFNNKQACINWLAKSRWGSVDDVICPHCNNDKVYKYSKNTKLYKCAPCKKQFTVRTGTIFEKSRIPLLKWFVAIYLFTSMKKGISGIQFSKYICITQKIAWFTLQRIREIMKDNYNKPFDDASKVYEAYIVDKETNRHMRDRVQGKKAKSGCYWYCKS